MQVGLTLAFSSPRLVCILGFGLTFLFGGKGFCFIYKTEDASEPCIGERHWAGTWSILLLLLAQARQKMDCLFVP